MPECLRDRDMAIAAGEARGDDDEALRLELARSYLLPRRGDSGLLATFAQGEVLAGRFVVERLLSRGGMGEVYVAFDRMLEQRVALKVMLATLADDDRAVRRLCHEVRTARRIRHPNVCGVYDVGVHDADRRDTCYFMTMAYIEGASLRSWSRKRQLPLACATRLSRQILAALDAAHSAGIVHGDLKADNVMVTGEPGAERAVLIDFGLARRIRGKARSAQPAGTVGYMAPELARGVGATVRTDVFAFGVVLFEMLTGCLPFDSEHGHSGALALRALRPELDAAHEAFIERCLRAAPEERFPSIASVRRALDGMIRGLGQTEPPASSSVTHVDADVDGHRARVGGRCP